MQTAERDRRGDVRAGDEAGGREPARRRGRRRRGAPYVAAGAAYLVLSVVVWWHLWAHPGSTTTCGCGDNALTLWVLQWPAYALAHGHNLFYSSALFHPHGINMVPNSLALGTVLAPVTWIWGPVAASNVLTTLSPPLSALAMFWLLRRWVPWAPAAFVGGLLYGFAPFALVSLALGHPNFGLLVLVPLIVGCLDELMFRRPRRPWLVGAGLGALAVAEFFVSVEVLLLLVLFWLVGTALVVLYATLRCPGELARRAGPVGRGLGTAAVVTVVLLAYPLWFYFAGPAHLSGRAWPNSPPGIVGGSLGDFVDGFVSPALTGTMHLFGGYQGPALPQLTFLGAGVLAVLVVGVAWWRRDRRLWLFGILGLLAAALSLGVHPGVWTPWRIVTHVPVLDNVVPVNVASITDLCAAVMVAIVIGHARAAVTARSAVTARAHVTTRAHVTARAAVAATAAAALAVVPIVVALWPNLPMTARPVTLPRWFATAAPRLTTRQVVLPYPAALGGIQSSMAWQAVDGLSFDMVGGGGPGIVPSRAGPERPGFEVLAAASVPLSPPPPASATNLRAIRRALAGWEVTRVVVPDQPELPTYDRGRGVPYAVGLFTAALGRSPVRQAEAWVWTDVSHPGTAVEISPSTFDHCVSVGSPSGSTTRVARCVLGAGDPR